jgi:hypothetical protein
MKITKSLVKKVIDHNKKSWHDQAWHDFNRLEEVEAINYGISQVVPQWLDLGDIVDKANEYLAVTRGTQCLK